MGKAPVVPEVRSSGRLYYLDWLRVLAVMGVMLQHSIYIPTSISEEASAALGVAVLPALIFAPAGITVFFLVSGSASMFALDRRSSRTYLKERALRLAVPFLVFSAIITPYMAWLAYHTRTPTELAATDPAGLSSEEATFLTQAPFWEYYSYHWLEWFPYNFPGTTPALIGLAGAHLWFIGFLFVFSVAGLPLLQWLRSDKAKGLINLSIRLASRRAGLVLFAVPVVVLGLVGVLLEVATGTAGDYYMGWGAFLRYFTIFILGGLLMCDQRVLAAVRRSWGWLLLAGVVGLAGFIITFVSSYTVALGFMQGAFAAVMEWCLALVVLRIGMGVLNRDGNTLKYCLGIVVAFYVLHFPVLATVDFWIVVDGFLAALADFSTLLIWITSILLSTAIILAIIEVVVRPIPPLRFLLGVPKERIPGQQRHTD